MKPQSNEGFVVSLDLVQKFDRESSLVFGTVNQTVMGGTQKNEILIVISLLWGLCCVMAVRAGLIAANMRHLAKSVRSKFTSFAERQLLSTIRKCA